MGKSHAVPSSEPDNWRRTKPDRVYNGIPGAATQGNRADVRTGSKPHGESSVGRKYTTSETGADDPGGDRKATPGVVELRTPKRGHRLRKGKSGCPAKGIRV